MIQSILKAAAHKGNGPPSAVGLAASCLACLFFLLLPLAGGCKTSQESATKSPRLASVVIKGRSAAEVSIAAERVFTGKGYQAGAAKSAHMVFEKQGSTANTLVYGDWSGKPVWFRVKIYLRDLGASGFLLDCDAYRVLERGDVHFEEERKLTRVHRGTYQQLLDEVSQGLQ